MKTTVSEVNREIKLRKTGIPWKYGDNDRICSVEGYIGFINGDTMRYDLYEDEDCTMFIGTYPLSILQLESMHKQFCAAKRGRP